MTLKAGLDVTIREQAWTVDSIEAGEGVYFILTADKLNNRLAQGFTGVYYDMPTVAQMFRDGTLKGGR